MKNKFVSGIANLFKINRTIVRGVEDVFCRRRRIRIVVLGSKNSGKTVFLTALASNLLNHRKEHFRLNGWEAYNEENMPLGGGREIPDFPYRRYRDGFAKGEWPEKTTDEMRVLRLPLVFRKDGCRPHDLLIELLDLPGERVGDLTMANKSYREWCEWMSANFGSQYSANGRYLEYLGKAKDGVASPDDLFAAYKHFLLDEYNDFFPWIVPSIVKLTEEGKGTGLQKELAERPLGLSKADQFAPVPVEWFDRTHEKHEWTQKFADAYDQYKAKIVDPISAWLNEADQLVYLVDVLNVLKCGKEVYNQEQKFGSAVLKPFSWHKTYGFGGVIRDCLSNLLKTRIKNAFLVVTKKDLAVSETSDNLRKLADELLGKELRGLKDGIGERNIKACAAVDTVRSKRDESGCEKMYAKTSPKEPETEYRQVNVPESWPSGENWEAQKKALALLFKDTYPQFDVRDNASPPQSGLDELMSELLASELK